MSKDDDNPFGSEPPRDPFGRPAGGDAYPPASGDPSTPPPPKAEDAWRSGPAPPPSGQWAAPPANAKADGAIAALVLGILGILLCPLCAPVAWGLGRKAERLVDASGGMLAGRGEATAGKILGMIGVAFIVLGIVAFIVLVAIGSSVDTSGGGTSTTFEF
jgi:hypothetical protein